MTMCIPKARVWALLGYDVVVELCTGRKGMVCGNRLGEVLVCERREHHRGHHAMVNKTTAARWRTR